MAPAGAAGAHRSSVRAAGSGDGSQALAGEGGQEQVSTQRAPSSGQPFKEGLQSKDSGDKGEKKKDKLVRS